MSIQYENDHEKTPTITPSKKPENEPTAKNKHDILLVDDEPANLMLYQAQFKRFGFLIDTANNGKQALDLWQKNKYKLILTDNNMPIMTGFELVKEIRSTEDSDNHTTIIMLAGDPPAGGLEGIREKGLDNYLIKPVDFNDLKNAVDDILNSF